MEAGIAAGVEEVVVVVVEVAEEVVVEGLGQGVGTLQVLHSTREDPVEGWGTFPLGPALARYSKQAGSWAQGQEEVEAEVVEIILHSSAKHVQMLEVEGRRQEGRLG